MENMTEGKKGRRDFLTRSVQMGAVAVGAGVFWNLFLAKTAQGQAYVPRPPGALPIGKFEAHAVNAGCVSMPVRMTRFLWQNFPT